MNTPIKAIYKLKFISSATLKMTIFGWKIVICFLFLPKTQIIGTR